MIEPPGWHGVAFSESADGDLRNDEAAREIVSDRLGIARDWAAARQVHGNGVKRVSSSGNAGEADAIWTTEQRLPLAIYTADCLGIVLTAPEAVGVAHAGWRGVAGDVIGRLRQEMTDAGHAPQRAAVGPGIGPCCFEVGPEVAAVFGAHVATTSWGSRSVDLPAAIDRQLEGLATWAVAGCTLHEDVWFSHRRDATKARMATIAWVT